MINPNDPMGMSRKLMSDRNTVPMVGGLLNQQMYQSPPIAQLPMVNKGPTTDLPPPQVKPMQHTDPLPPPVQTKPVQRTTPLPRPRLTPFLDEFRRRTRDARMRRRFGMMGR